jgi:S1-C subfamily serine protease
MLNGQNRGSALRRRPSLAVLLCLALPLGACDRLRSRDDKWLGLEVEPLTETPDKPQPVRPVWLPRGVRVAGVEGAAAAAGVQKGDVVTRVNGRPVADVPSFEQAASAVPDALAAQIEVVRGQTPLALVVPPRSSPPGSPLGAVPASQPDRQAGARWVATPQGGPGQPSILGAGSGPDPSAMGQAAGLPWMAAPPPDAWLGSVVPAVAQAFDNHAPAAQLPELGIEVADLGADGVDRVYRGSWGERAGLRAEDRVVGFGGQPVGNVSSLAALVGRAPAEKLAALRVSREGRILLLQVMVGEGELETATVPSDAAPPFGQAQVLGQQAAAAGRGGGAAPGSGSSGSRATLVRKLGVQIVPGPEGVLVDGVMGNSHAARGGLRAGDVVVRVGNRRVKTVRRFARMVTRAPAETMLELKVLRGGRPVLVSVEVGEGELEGVTPIARP